MPSFHSNKEKFYYDINSSDKISDQVKRVIGDEKSMFYEICKQFANIGINAPKKLDENNLSIQGYFQYEDIARAEEEACRFIEKVGMIDDVLDAFHYYHGYAVDWNQIEQTQGIIMKYGSTGGIGQYVNFAHLPENQWILIQNEIIERLKKNNQDV